MEGCLYKNNSTDTYYLINSIATYTMLAVEFETFQIDNFDYELIQFNLTNIKNLLDKYTEFNSYIDYSNLSDFNIISYNNRNYYIRSWLDVFNFATGRI